MGGFGRVDLQKKPDGTSTGRARIRFRFLKDAEAAAGILELEGLAREDCRDFVLEGGSVHGDGVGTVLATETCLLNENRNPGLGRDGGERELRRRRGARKVVWLPRGIVWDGDTDGHVDNFACFAGPGRVLLSWCECCLLYTSDAADE